MLKCFFIIQLILSHSENYIDIDKSIWEKRRDWWNIYHYNNNNNINRQVKKGKNIQR